MYVAVNESQFSLLAEPTDVYSGVTRVRLLDGLANQVSSHDFDCSTGCPTAPAAVALSGPVSSLTTDQTYTVEVTDAVGLKSFHPVRLVADRDAPLAPAEVALRSYTVGAPAAIGWETQEDPDIGTDLRGSGIARSEYRVQRLLGSFGPWESTEEDQFEISALPAETVQVEVRSVDAAGNVGPTAGQTVTIVPTNDPTPAQPVGGTNTIWSSPVSVDR
ncbi:hypothetical protein, partial [Paraconexibacter algicola]|uniref:hypothetical protein n=1 Tax=Paraconexibacter algicola TaxID=2133960 RepID=UPI0011B21098